MAADAMPGLQKHTNATWSAIGGSVELSVVVPFYRFDVSGLASRLDALARDLIDVVEVIFLDDGSPDRVHFHRLATHVDTLRVAACAARLDRNLGRAAIRNELVQLARSESLLYLDADMWPDDESFLTRYVRWKREGRRVIYGGRTALTAVRHEPAYRLHRRFTMLREAVPAVIRRQSPVLHFYSCNFLVSKQVLQRHPLDVRFTGWGWEDCEWASRVSGTDPIEHEDNTASHLGLLTVDEILEKYEESTGNFRLILARCPSLVSSTALYRVARALRKLRLGPAVRCLSRFIARAAWLPDRARVAGLMFYKAAIYAPLV